jgi:hypothetical protein
MRATETLYAGHKKCPSLNNKYMQQSDKKNPGVLKFLPFLTDYRIHQILSEAIPKCLD